MWRAASARCLFVAARSYRPSVSPAPRSFWGVSRGLSSHASRPLLMSPVSVSTTTTLTTMTTSNDAPCDAPVSEDDQVVINPDGTISHVQHVHGGDHAHHHHGASSTTTTLTTVVEAQTFYRRPLPPMLTSFQSTEGKKLFRRALEANYLEAYFALASNFVTQAEPAYCGLSCLSMVLNTLEVDPGRKWKGIWRWFSEEMLSCCAPLSRVVSTGITFLEFGCLAQCNGLDVESFLADQSSKDSFRDAIRASCSRTDSVLVVSYSRAALGQTGGGHFSPIGAYDPISNMVLILDVARFKYPSYWVHIDRLWDALQPVDAETGRPRGYFLLKKAGGNGGGGEQNPPALDQLGVSRDTWPAVAAALRSLRAGNDVATQNDDVIQKKHVQQHDVMRGLLGRTASHDGISATVSKLRAVLPKTATISLSDHAKAIMSEAALHPLYSVVRSLSTENKSEDADAWMTVLLLGMPTWLNSAALAREMEMFAAVPTSVRLKGEIGRMRQRIATIENLSSCRNCGPAASGEGK